MDKQPPHLTATSIHTTEKPALFIRNSQEPVVVDSTTIMKWGADENKTVEFHPVPVTQNIDVFFDLKKDGSVQFKVDSVWCIMSGIPHRMNVGTGGLDVSRTDKIMFRTYFVNTNTVPTYNSERLTDEVGNVNLRCHANITVPGIVENTVTDANTYIGPGVMQIIIYTTIKDETYTGPKEEKILMGMVNLHKSLGEPLRDDEFLLIRTFLNIDDLMVLHKGAADLDGLTDVAELPRAVAADDEGVGVVILRPYRVK